MFRYLILTFSLVLVSFQGVFSQEEKGFFDFTYSEDEGTVLLKVPNAVLGEEFLYVNSLSAGLGSNDIGLDRGQLGDDRLVRIEKHGKKLMLVQLNTDYRALSDNELERKAVEEAFAKSILWGWDIKESEGDTHIVDITDFLLRDAHGVAARLKRGKQGNFSADKSRSAVNKDRTKSFPDNTEFDAFVSFKGQADGGYLRSVTPEGTAVTVQQHHSFIRLPDDNYTPRKYHPYSGFNLFSYYDYATPIESPISKKFIRRHRLDKKNKNAAVSEAVEPIVYYMDPGCPDPVKTALMEGAKWWDQAFQAAGFAPNTFQIKELPAGADMMDVRYNVIQWVHRSTRGWSYGASVSDPRTGEIIKGHVSLGSLRVRQDFLIAQGLLSPYGTDDNNHSKMKEMALARLRQLAAHEVGHTIGLAHNFAASTNDRASVMDYPHPYIELDVNGELDFSEVYDDKIGEWDKATIFYGYADFATEAEEEKALQDHIVSIQKKGLRYISDRDSRPLGGAHPYGHLWDSRPDASEELNRMMKMRSNALKRMGEASITTGTPLSELEKVLVPVYLMHRFQVEAASKLIGGLQYSYTVKGDGLDHKVRPVALRDQDKAIRSILNTLSAEELKLPQSLIEILPPTAMGYRRDRETFSGRTNVAFDVLSPAEAYADAAFSMLLHKDRLTRIHRHHAAHNHSMRLDSYLDQMAAYLFEGGSANAYGKALEEVVQHAFIMHLLHKVVDKNADPSMAAIAHGALMDAKEKYLSGDDDHVVRLVYLVEQALEDPTEIELPQAKSLPPGSPIGCSGHF